MLLPPPHERNEQAMVSLRHAAAVVVRFPSPHVYEKLLQTSSPSLYTDFFDGWFLLLLLIDCCIIFILIHW
jgi:hypothetical protein